MRTLSRKNMWMAAIAACGLVVPPQAWSDGPAAAPAAAEQNDAPAMRDVALAKGGAFTGRVVNEQGAPLDGVVVKTTRRGEKIAQETTTDSEGRFRFTGMKGGVYLVQTPQSEKWYRVWPAEAAPDQAVKTVVMSGTSTVVRGQFGFLDPANTTAILLGAAGVTLSAITLAKVNDLDDDNNKKPTSP